MTRASRVGWIVVLTVLFLGRALCAGPITFQSAALRTDVVVDAITVGGGATDHQEGHDTGSLAQPSASTSAVASLAFSGTNFPAARGDAAASVNLSDALFQLSGSANSVVFVKSTPFSGKSVSQALTTVRFNLAAPGSYDLNYDAGVTALNLNGKTRLNLTLLGAGDTQLDALSLPATLGSDHQTGKRALNLAACDYTLNLDALANADLIGALGEGDSGNITYQVSIAPTSTGGGNGGVTIPLPPALVPGLIMLAFAALLVRTRRYLLIKNATRS